MYGVRKAMKEFCATLREILDENSRLRAENDELRQLLTDYYNAPCMVCNPWAKEHRCKHDEGGNCLLVTRAVELGIGEDKSELLA